MWRITSCLQVSRIAALIVSTLVVVNSVALAQDNGAQSNQWESSPTISGEAAADPDSRLPPLNLAGCWSGTIDDGNTGMGSGAIFFVQREKKLTIGTFAIFEFNGGRPIAGHLSGKANSQNFQLKIHIRKCNASLHGTLSPMGDLTGMYHFSQKCLGQVDQGTFDYTFDPSGTSCPQ